MADGMGAAHRGYGETIDDGARFADLLINLYACSYRHHAQPRRDHRQRSADLFYAVGVHGDDCVRVSDRQPDRAAGSFAKSRREIVEILLRIRRLDRDLHFAGPLCAVYGDARGVRSAIAQRHQHIGKHRAKVRLEPPIF